MISDEPLQVEIMANKSNRRDPRVNVALDVKLQTGRGMETFETKNISYRGIFLVAEDPLPLRRITRIEMDVGSERVAMLGMVAHRINVSDASERRIAPGMGIQIFSVGQAARDAWYDHVGDLVEKDPELAKAVHDHSLPKFRVHLASEDMLKTFVERDFPQGQIYYRTPEPMPLGSELMLEIGHPLNTQQFTMKGRVKDVTEGARRHRGMYVELYPLDEELTEAFDLFVRSAAE